jgi:hypothetical protein
MDAVYALPGATVFHLFDSFVSALPPRVSHKTFTDSLEYGGRDDGLVGAGTGLRCTNNISKLRESHDL